MGTEQKGTRINGHQNKWAPGQMGTRTYGNQDIWAMDNWAPRQMSNGQMGTRKLFGAHLSYNRQLLGTAEQNSTSKQVSFLFFVIVFPLLIEKQQFLFVFEFVLVPICPVPVCPMLVCPLLICPGVSSSW